MYTAERYHDFSCGHRVYGHESKCAHLHGHNYRVTFVCAADEKAEKPFQRTFLGKQEEPTSGELDLVGRVIDFSTIKETLCEFLEIAWDHKTLIWVKDPMLPELRKLDPDGVVGVAFNPTAENMAQFLVEVVGPEVLRGTGVRLIECRVEETRKCSATYRK